MSYTKGPLRISAGPSQDGDYGIFGPGGILIGEAFCRIGLKDAEANARLWAAAPDLLAALKELLASREMQCRIGLWIERFPHIKTSSIEPKSVARVRFEVWYTRATCRVIRAEDRARVALAAAEEAMEGANK